MTIDEFRTLLRVTPFRPFTMHLADGRHVIVDHPGFAARAPSGRTVFVYGRNDDFHLIDLLLVTDLEVGANGGGEPRDRR